MNLPVFEVQVTNGDELTAVALVDAPAIERSWIAFQKQTPVRLSAARQIVTGPLLIPEQMIYRKQDSGEFYLKYTKEAITSLMLNFMANQRTAEVNLMHNENVKPKGVYLFEVFQSDESRGIKAPEAFSDLPDGTLFASAKIEDAETWAAVQNGELTGFSIEAWVTPVEVEQVDIELAAEFCRLVERLVNQSKL